MTIEERYKQETGESCGVELAEQCYYYDEAFITWLKSIAEKYFTKQKTKAHLFVDSPYYDAHVLEDKMVNEFGWTKGMVQYYYLAMCEWSSGVTAVNGKPQKKTDWHLVALAWERKDKRQGTGYYYKKFDKAEEKRKQQIEAMK